VLYYIPDRYDEGYGISEKGVQWASENGVNLIISLDCGIKAIEKSKLASQLGMDLIVCDHHLPGENLPQAVAVLDPKRADCPYPYKDLSGAGIAFKLMQGFSIYNQLPAKELYDYLDLVAISIAADLVPITGENRILTYFGLKKLNRNPRPGIQALKQKAGLKSVDVSGIVFGIGPRINACGRIDHAKGAVEILLSKSASEAEEMAHLVDDHNSIRRDFDKSITEEAMKMLQENPLIDTLKSTVLFKEDWHKGVIGIVASRCVEKYYRPTIILTKSNGKVTGSARSIIGFDVYEAISRCSELLDQYGGHKYAAGLTLSAQNLLAFTEKFETVVSQLILNDQLVPQLEIDLEINFQRVGYKFYNILKQIGPYGPENMTPIFSSKNLYLSREPSLIKEEHLKFYVKQHGSTRSFEAIGFGLKEFYDELMDVFLSKGGKVFEMAYQLEENDYQGQKTLQLRVKDIRFAS
jgi:single-stranded-DNA-specific exonuclease